VTIREYKSLHRPSLPDEVLYAGEYLESKGFEFLVYWGTANAVDRAAWFMTEAYEKDNGRWIFGKYWD
jgi:hypothetical protein